MKVNKQLYSNLLDLGFSERDAEVYLALIESGPATSGPLIKATNLHRNIVYTSLAHLVARKLVSEKSVRGIKQFAVVNPQALADEYAAKAETAHEVSASLSNLIDQGKTEEITIHQGNEEYLTLLTGLLRALPKGATKYVIGTGGEDFMRETMRPIWKKYHRVALAQGIQIKMIAYESQRASLAAATQHPPIYEVRYLPNQIENPAGIHVYPEANTVLNIMYSSETDPVTAIKIVNPKLVAGYFNLFGNLWKVARP